MKRPNTSFGLEDKQFNPVGRWKAASPDAVAFCESLIGPALDERHRHQSSTSIPARSPCGRQPTSYSPASHVSAGRA
jgi:hypothetical protein